MPEISVIVPVYKVERYLSECVDSILEQTFKDYELILVDDGSPDCCGAMCDDYAKTNRRVHVIHQENRGLSAARNSGLDIALGKYIAFIDSDDVVRIDYLEELYTSLLRHNADISVCNYWTFHDAEDWDCRRGTDNNDEVVLDKRSAVLSLYSNEEDHIFFTAWGFLFKRHLFDGMRFPVGKIGEDQDLIPRVVYRADTVVWIKKDLYGYRNRGGSISNQERSLKIFDDVEAQDTCISFFRNHQETELADAAAYLRENTLSYYTLLARKYGFYKDLPSQYKMGRIRAVLNLRKNLPRKYFLHKVYEIYPGYIRMEENYRRFLEIIGLRNPKDRWL